MAISDNYVPNDPDGAPSALPQRGVQLTANGAIAIAHGVVFLNKATALAATLDDPPVGMPFCKLTIIGQQDAAHTVTLAASSVGFNSAGSSSQLLTLSGLTGDGVELYGIDGVWYVLNWQDIPVSTTFGATA
jgi:hypothetical protein